MHTLRRSRSSASQCPAAPTILQKKLVVLGDAGCGKTSLLFRLTYNAYPPYPRVIPGYDDYEKFDDSHRVRLMLVDTNTDYERLYRLFCSLADVVLACFAIDSSESLERLASYWKPEVADKYCAQAPIILVGTKADLREDDDDNEKRKVTTREEAMKILEMIGATMYIECSAKFGDNVREVFDAAAELVAARHTAGIKDVKADRRKSKCLIS